MDIDSDRRTIARQLSGPHFRLLGVVFMHKTRFVFKEKQ